MCRANDGSYRLESEPMGLLLRNVIAARNSDVITPSWSGPLGRPSNDADEGYSHKLHNADAPPFPRRYLLITVVDGIIEVIESLSVVAILAPITRLRQEAVLAFSCSDDDPHLGFLSLTLLFRAAIPVLGINRNSRRGS